MKYNLKGGAMIFALSILLLSSVLISLFLSLNSSFNKIHKKYTDYDQAINKLNEGFKLGYYLSSSTYKGDDNQFTKGVYLKKDLWGCYFRISSQVDLDSSSAISQIGLIGNQLKKDYSLYLANTNSKLSLTGNTIIKGNCFLPEKGVGISYVEGKSYTRKTLVDGDIKKSNSSLPPINPFLIQENKLKLNGVYNLVADSLISVNELESTSVNHSFFNKTLVIRSANQLVLDDSWDLSGNIIVYSPASIVVTKGARLNNIVVYSKEIVIRGGVSVSSQFIAEKSVVLDSNSILNYPSLVCALGDSSRINLSGDSRINGALISYSENSNSYSSISLGEKSIVTGLVYTNNKMELKGKVRGKLVAKKLFYKSPSTEYTNTLIDAEIDNSLVPDFYCIPSIFKTNESDINLVKWLN